MPRNIVITKTSGPSTVDIPEDVANDLKETYELLKDMPVNNAGTYDFSEEESDPAKAAKLAREFVRQGTAWAEGEGLRFQRRGSVKDNPTVVIFRIYKPKEGEGRGRPKANKNAAK